MQAAPQTIEIHDVAQLSAARHDLDLFLQRCSLPTQVTYDLLTCIQEAATNALRFAGDPRGVQISVSVASDEVVVMVRDHGAGFDLQPLGRRSPDPLNESGRGLFLLQALMDEVEFRIEGGTEVRLHKRLPLRTTTDSHAA